MFAGIGNGPGYAFITEDTEDTGRRPDSTTKGSIFPCPLCPLCSIRTARYAARGAGWGTASRMGMFTTAASAARTMSAYHIQS